MRMCVCGWHRYFRRCDGDDICIFSFCVFRFVVYVDNITVVLIELYQQVIAFQPTSSNV